MTKRETLEALYATWAAHWPVADVPADLVLEEHRAADERLGRSFLEHIVSVAIAAPSVDEVTVTLQARMLLAAMAEAVESSDEIGLAVLDALAP